MEEANEFDWRSRVGFTNIHIDTAYETPAWMRSSEQKFTVAFDQAKKKMSEMHFASYDEEDINRLRDRIVAQTPYEMSNAFVWLLAYTCFHPISNTFVPNEWKKLQRVIRHPNDVWKPIVQTYGLTPSDVLRYVLCLDRILSKK